MMISKTTSYALRVLIYMSQHESDRVTADSLFEKLKISKRYLRKLMTDLSKLGFITGFKGKNGGFVFAKSCESIYLADIINSIEGKEIFKSCIMGFENCKLVVNCSMHNIWVEMMEKILLVFSTISLQDLKDNSRKNLVSSLIKN